MQVEQYYSNDYAGLDSGRFSFYYGYEVEDPSTEEWCFQVKENNKEIFNITSSYIEKQINNLNTPQDYLIAGIGIWLLLK